MCIYIQIHICAHIYYIFVYIHIYKLYYINYKLHIDIWINRIVVRFSVNSIKVVEESRVLAFLNPLVSDH